MPKMAKLKRLERAKVKLKKKKLLKAQNVTDTSFKVKKIVIPGQLGTPKEGEIHTQKKLNVKELLSHLQHYNVSIRRQGISGLNELVLLYEDIIINLHLPEVIDALCRLALDVEGDVRKSSVKLLEIIVSKLNHGQIEPHFDIMRTYMCCAMTHVSLAIREDSLLLLDVLLNTCPHLLACKADDILPTFLNMISNIKNESERSRTLFTHLDGRITSVQWRIKVFARMTRYFDAIVNSKKNVNEENSGAKSKKNIVRSTPKLVKWSEDSPLYVGEFFPCMNDVCFLPNIFSLFSNTNSLDKKKQENIINEDGLLKVHVEDLMSVLYEAWIEVAPDMESGEANVLSHEAAVMLQYIVETLQQLYNSITSWEQESNMKNLTAWFKKEYGPDIVKAFGPGFPFSLQESVFKPKGFQPTINEILRLEKTSPKKLTALGPKLTHQNLCLSYLFTCIHDKISKEMVQQVLNFVQSCVRDFKDMELLPVLVKLLDELFRVENPWPKTDILVAILTKYQDQSANEYLRQKFFLFLCHYLSTPRSDSEIRSQLFKRWICELPYYIFQSQISIEMVKTLARLACHNHGGYVSTLKRRARSVILSLFEMKITGISKPIEGQKAILEMLYHVADPQLFDLLLKSIAASGEEEHNELVTYVNNLKSLSEYLSL